MSYRRVQQVRCFNAMSGDDHLANVFQHTDTRWYWHPGTQSRIRQIPERCAAGGYDTATDAEQAVIAAWETEVTL